MKTLALKFTALLLSLFGMSLSPSVSAQESAQPWAWRGQTIEEFDSSLTAVLDWQVVNDGVMGGLSKGKVEITDEGIMDFSGTLSLENNGGFSTVRSEAVNLNLSNDLGILLKVRGDGREYQVRLDSDATYRGMPVSFAGTFATEAGQWRQVKIPFSAFEGSWRGTELPNDRLNPAMIRRVGILLGDKKNGPFSLEIDYIRTYGKGQGDFTERTPNALTGKPEATGPKSLISTMVNDERFSTLKAALDAARLTPFFQWDNKLTVFAPTNEAFANLPEGVLEDLLKPENKERLVSILSFHVHPGSLDLAEALRAGDVKTIEGTPLKVSFTKGRVRINNAELLNADIECADGTIHAIDTVLLPEPTRKTLITTAQDAGMFSTLLAAAKAAGLAPALEGKDPLTVFAPTDAAFAALPEGTVESLLKEGNRDKLTELLTSHVISGNVSAGDALNARTAQALSGKSLKFSIDNGLFTVNGSAIRNAGIDAGNGTIHVISSVIGFAETDPSGGASECDKGSNADCQEKCSKAETPSTTEVKPMNAETRIVAAIAEGVPLYNNGKIEACADVYQNCLISLSQSERLDPLTRKSLSQIADAGEQYGSNERAWFYRHALDQMMAMITTGRS